MAVEYIRRLIVSGPEISQTVDLKVGTYTIGRQAGNEIRLNSPMISRRHSQIKVTAKTCQVTDLGSANGTSVNGQVLAANTPKRLGAGDVIEVGPFKLTYEQIAVEPIAAPPPPKPRPAPKPKPVAKKKATKPEPRQPAKAPPSIPPPPPPVTPTMDYSQPPPGMSRSDSRFLEYLPGIYHTDFMARFLAIFEAVLAPIEWNVDNFDLFLNPTTTPEGFLPWLANWFSLTFDPTWSVEKQRTLLAEAHEIFARRGTRWALSRVLEIYTGSKPEIDDMAKELNPDTFAITVPFAEKDIDRELIEHIIDTNKPAHTTYELSFKAARSRSKARSR